MISETLRQVRDFEKQESALITKEERPEYHFSPYTGWLNDPNGFSFYRGRYHLFYQNHPFSSYWGPMHWGHAVSSDLINWEYKPCAMAPDTDYDGSGCFSGTAITLEDGRQLLMYTGCGSNEEDPLKKGRWLQTQCVAVSETQADGSTEYVKYEGNPVIGAGDLPEDCDPYEFRDPYIWRLPDGTYKSVAAAGRTGEIGEDGNYHSKEGTLLIVYKSRDGFTWEYDKELFKDHRRIGVMWECPNFFELDGKQILIASPMDMEAEADEAMGSVRFPQGSNVCCIAGSYDEESSSFTPDGGYEPVDLGLDFYAPQVMKTPDGRTVMIGWMQDPKNGNFANAQDGLARPGLLYAVPMDYPDGYIHGPEAGTRIFGQMTIPRELHYRDGRLCQWPVRELRDYRRDKLEYNGVKLENEERGFAGLSGRSLEINLEIAPREEGAALYREFSMEFAKDEEHSIRLSYRPGRSLITIDRSRSGQCSRITARRSSRVAYNEGRLSLRILIDKWSAEIFVNGGEQVLSLTYYTPLEAEGISFSADGSAIMDLTSYKIQRSHGVE